MQYEEKDFLETAGQDTLKQIARARELTREYLFRITRIPKKDAPSLKSYSAESAKMWRLTRRFIATTGKTYL